MPVDYLKDRRYCHLSAEQVQLHYEVERELRDYILNSPKDKRAEAFNWAYDELFRRVPWHPALTEQSGVDAEQKISSYVRKIKPWLGFPPGAKILEIGCGMGSS